MKLLFAFSAAGIAGLAVAAYTTFGPGKLTYGDKTVDTSFIVENGKTYVPLNDVASALNCVIQKSDSGYTLAPIGKGAMVMGTEGKIGQTLGKPDMQFTVRSVKDVGTHYDRQFSPGEVNSDEGTRLILMVCRVRNGTPKTVSICTVGGDKTALADMDEHTYEVLTGDGPRNVDILPGAVSDFGILFKLPKAEKLKALVYQTDGFPTKEIFRVSVADWENQGSGGN